MKINLAAFAGSYPNIQSCPKDGKPEYAFIGRSNVGKSSLINTLCGRNDLAHTSNQPGKTQMINHYLINGDWYLVDLPGYGYARISKKKRQAWRRMIESYLQQRGVLQCIFVLLDVNVPAQQIDIEFINWLGECQLPFVIVYTKADRSRSKLQDNIDRIESSLLEHWEALPQRFVTSSNSKLGREEILTFIDDLNQQYKETLEMLN